MHLSVPFFVPPGYKLGSSNSPPSDTPKGKHNQPRHRMVAPTSHASPTPSEKSSYRRVTSLERPF